MALTLKFPAFHGSCPRHTRYNPSIGGQDAIKAGCEHCYRLYAVFRASQELRIAREDWDRNSAKRKQQQVSA